MLDCEADINSSPEGDHPPFQTATLKGSESKVRILLSHGANVNRKTASENTALSYAVKKGHAGIVKHLLDSCADPNVKGHVGFTQLLLTRAKGYG